MPAASRPEQPVAHYISVLSLTILVVRIGAFRAWRRRFFFPGGGT
jgi:hypothetical protein